MGLISFKCHYPGMKVWHLRWRGTKNTYPMLIEFNLQHCGMKVFHGPFWSKKTNRYGYAPGQPLLWGTGGLLDLHVHKPSTGTRLWLYSRWCALGHIDIFINRKRDVHPTA